jgi:peptidoglycan/xylan/chitin deacetylase (PgdA/CDA1 family)
MTIALIYHDVVGRGERDRSGMPGPIAARYKLDPAQFEAHLAAVAATGRSVGLLDRGPRPDVAFTFDDGGASATAAATMLEARGWRGHFYVTTDRIGTPGFLDEDGIRDLADRGHVVGSHSHTHPRYMGRLSVDELGFEWEHSRDVLARVLGAAPRTAAVPGGYLTPRVVDTAATTGYALLLTSEPSARAQRRSGIEYLGRYTIWDSTPPAAAAAYARGAVFPRARLWTEWQAKKAAKRGAPGAYRALQRLRASRA